MNKKDHRRLVGIQPMKLKTLRPQSFYPLYHFVFFFALICGTAAFNIYWGEITQPGFEQAHLSVEQGDQQGPLLDHHYQDSLMLD